MKQSTPTQHCNGCGFDYPASEEYCPSCGMVAERDRGSVKPRYKQYFVVLVIICILAIFIAPR